MSVVAWPMRVSAFSLVELLVVVALMSVIFALVPSGLRQLHSANELTMMVEKVATRVRNCSLQSQRTQQTRFWGDAECVVPSLPSGVVLHSKPATLVFRADGSSTGGQFVLTAASESSSQKERRAVVDIDPITSLVSVRLDALSAE